jgi:hypothetical protein
MSSNQRSIPCSCDPQSLVLTPNVGIDQSHGGVNAIVDVQEHPDTGKTGTISFSGGVKAFLTYDETGSLLGYTLTDSNASTETSVANILSIM